MSKRKYEPEDFARALLSELKISRIGNLNEILHSLRIDVVEKDLTSFEGVLVRRSDRSKGIIAVKRDVREPGRKNFTICHEIGHFLLPSHGSFSCKADDIESWRGNIKPYELEANRFASELLLPTKEIYPIVNKKKATISLAKDLASEFKTSLTATTRKCIEVSEERCAVIWSVNEEIKWFKKNDNFHHFINRKHLDSQSLASKLFSQKGQVREMDNFVNADSWLEDESVESDFRLWEDSIYLPYYKGVLTILIID